jgi:hypothetical protein
MMLVIKKMEKKKKTLVRNLSQVFFSVQNFAHMKKKKKKKLFLVFLGKEIAKFYYL